MDLTHAVCRSSIDYSVTHISAAACREARSAARPPPSAHSDPCTRVMRGCMCRDCARARVAVSSVCRRSLISATAVYSTKRYGNFERSEEGSWDTRSERIIETRTK